MELEWEKIRALGQGGVGRVYLCEEKRTGKQYAIKEVQKTSSRIARLEAEKEALGSSLHSSFENDDMVYLVMEYFSGEPLYKVLWRNGRFPSAFAKQCAAQLVLAVTDLHSRGFMHRDIKTGNFLLDPDGKCHLIDFGFAKAIDKTSASSKALTLCGTHYTMAPEVFRRLGHSCEVDWWAVGVFIFEMLCGSPPWPYKCDDSDLQSYFNRIEETSKELDVDSLIDDKDACDLISRLLTLDPTARLDGSGVKSHPWFCGVDWENPVHLSTTDLEPLPAITLPTPPPNDSAESITSAENALFEGF
ncbi:hypothetical protein Ae201684P_001634 [Aphanomyces euteiches]|uniref:Protein kinase domain-containing protein n=1 Tax=Aphanomyces euteiches TaxID=100861 RepID=A0A6G0X9B6_9STRA|nr:hypothetical protein Ae201684_007132 [Aphanomyces euteiches]KAH9052454.1 hypothetical protein Ae201684P_001634 [Aphanomyces euteiches]